MQLNVQVVSVEHNIEIEKKSGGVYPGSRLTYRYDGKIQEQAFHTNSLKYNPKLGEQLKEVKAGDNVIIDKIKEGEFWKVQSITKGGETTITNETPATKGSSAQSAPKSTYATPEERAATQVYIVRQSSLSNAVALANAIGDKKATTSTIIANAKQFEAFVLGIEFDDGSPGMMLSDDIDVE